MNQHTKFVHATLRCISLMPEDTKFFLTTLGEFSKVPNNFVEKK